MNSVNIGLMFDAVDLIRSFTSRNSDSLRAARSCRASDAIASSIPVLVKGQTRRRCGSPSIQRSTASIYFLLGCGFV